MAWPMALLLRAWLLVAALCGVWTADPACYDLLDPSDDVFDTMMLCNSTTIDHCFLVCGICTTPELRIGLSAGDRSKYCPTRGGPGSAPVEAAEISTLALLNVSAMQGYYWLDGGGPETNATECMLHLVKYLPRRDMLLLFSNPYQFIDYLTEHVRFSLKARQQFKFASETPWSIFLDHVLPHSLIDEKRDLWWRWRPRFFQLFAPIVGEAKTVTDAVHLLAAAIPGAELEGTLALMNETQQTQQEFITGPPVTWRSSTAPAYLSPQQVAQQGASCTGTAIVLAVACRAVGIPARIAGCSESIVANDDHHWIEFYDSSDAGPFLDGWHTKEGVSKGNEGGPWDAPSTPMGNCCAGVVPRDQMHSMWATEYSSSRELPTLWHNSSWSSTWGHIGGVNRCGAYCTAWGCGPNRTDMYSQPQCDP